MHLRCDVEIPVNEYKQHLRRLALHDDALLNAIAAEGSSFPASVIDAKSAALVRVAATIAVDCGPRVVESAVALALTTGATSDEIVATLESVTPVTGAALRRPGPSHSRRRIPGRLGRRASS